MVSELNYIKAKLLSLETIGAIVLRRRRSKCSYFFLREFLEQYYMNYVRGKYVDFDPRKTIWKKISIGVVSTCNGTCSFCPSPKLGREYTHIDMNLFRNIILQLEDMNYSAVIDFHLQSDPFVAPDIIELIQFVVWHCPKALILLSTNGLGLTEEKYHAVFKYLNVEMRINDYSQDGRKRREVLAWSRTKFERKRTFVVNRLEPPNKMNVAFFKSSLNLPLHQFCAAPFTQLCIGTKGEGVMCCSDWERYYTDIGSAESESLMDIWSGERMSMIRRDLLENKRCGLCAKCDALGNMWTLKR